MSETQLQPGVAGGAPVRAPTKGRDIGIRRRRAAEARFKAYGLIAITLALAFLAVLVYSVVSKGYQAFVQTEMTLDVTLDESILDPNGLRDTNPAAFEAEMLDGMNFLRFSQVLRPSLYEALELDTGDRAVLREANVLISRSAPAELRAEILRDPSIIGTTQTMQVLADAKLDSYYKGIMGRETIEERRQLTDQQLDFGDKLEAAGVVSQPFNYRLFVNVTSKRPEAAGLGVALIGSLQMMLVVLVVALPIGVAASIYLEEFAPKNRWTDLIEVNINNLAAVPSIVFGILGLAVFINFMGLPRSAPLVGGLVLSLMTLPTIIIATRASLKAVPPSIREAALGVGASKMQSVFHHVLPLAMPGILTGTIIGLAQALGETAPLLMVGLDAFVTRYPSLPTEPATSLPSQIYSWSREDDRVSFDPRTSAAIMVLLGFMAIMNVTAILLRRRFERRW